MKIICIVSCAGFSKNIPLLRRCLLSIKKASSPHINTYIVITTNHTKRYIQKLDHLFDKIVVSPESSGFVEINNEAVKKTTLYHGDFYLFINDDAWIDPDFFSNLQALSHTHDTSDIFVPLVHQSDTNIIDSFGIEYFTSGYAKNTSSTHIYTSLATFSCLCIKHSFLKTMMQTYGFFLNPMLHWYFDDVEFCIRALALGATVEKSASLKAHHIGTFTWKKRSPFVVYQNYRNLLWTIILTWPKKTVVKHMVSVLCIQLILCIYSVFWYGPWMYYKIVTETIEMWQDLIEYRRKIIDTYPKGFVFDTIFSPHRLRTKYGAF